jgi:hypothetical protein
VTENEERPAKLQLHSFELWEEYEKIAVHFNDLILRLRVQALGGVAAIAALAGFVLKEHPAGLIGWKVLAVAFAVLLIFWIALCLLDLLYYNPLLLGAVDAILEIESASQKGKFITSLNLSTKIKAAVENRCCRWRRSLCGPIIFYLLVAVVLIVLFLFSVWQGWPSVTPTGG